MNAKFAWIIQEIPAFLTSAILFWEAKDEVSISQTVVLGMFLVHYFNRLVKTVWYVKGIYPVIKVWFML